MALILEKSANLTSVFLLLLVLTLVSVINGIVYKVGDLAGWTIINGTVDYKQWSLHKTFQLGDTIVFKYISKFHNVMQLVTHAEYQACNVSSPISKYTSGNDSITIDTHGHHFFVCGVPGHCQAGQKVDINVVLHAPLVGPSPSGPPSPVTSKFPTVAIPAPSPSGAPMVFEKLGWLLLLLQLLNVFGLA